MQYGLTNLAGLQ